MTKRRLSIVLAAGAVAVTLVTASTANAWPLTGCQTYCLAKTAESGHQGTAAEFYLSGCMNGCGRVQ